jgi:MFS transporter, DHA1 family, multidrug resistance protein
VETKISGVFGVSRTLLLDRNIRVLAITGLISGLYLGMLNVVLQLFPLSLGFSVAEVGLLQALGNRFSGAAATIAQPLAGHYSDVHRRRTTILLGSITTIASMLCFAEATVASSVALMVVAFILFGISILGGPASQALVAESVDLDSRQMDIAYSAIFFLSTVPGIVTPYLAGAILDTFGYLVIFAVAASLEGVDLLLFWKELYETKHSLAPDSSQRSFSFREAFRLPRASTGFYGALAMDAFAFNVTTSIIYAMLAERFGFTGSDIGLIVAVWYLAMLVSQYPSTRLLLKIGAKKTVILSEALGTLLMAGWAVSSQLPEFIVLSIVFGVSVTTWVPAVQTMMMVHAPARERGGVGGKVAAFRGLVAFPGPIIGGLIYQTFGYEGPVLFSTVMTVITILLMIRYLPSRSSISVVDMPAA